MPPLSVDSGAVDTSDQEIVRCICEVEEENDFMIQVKLVACLFLKHRILFFKDLHFYNHACPSLSVKLVCAGSMAPAWACWKTMFPIDTPATSAETHQVREERRNKPTTAT